MYSLYSAFLIILFARRIRSIEIAIKRKRSLLGEIAMIILLILFSIYLFTISQTLKK
jgi:hypothetical protein